MRDRDVRNALKVYLKEEHEGETDTLVVEEMGVNQGSARIDVAVINGSINGFEIKSAKDNLSRLPRQIMFYNSIFDYVTLLAARNHIAAAAVMVPAWWGITEAILKDGEVFLTTIRDPRQNQEVNPHDLVKLLWRQEALEILVNLNLDKGIRTKPRRVLWQRLVSEIEVGELGTIVRNTLKSRQNWSTAVPL